MILSTSAISGRRKWIKSGFGYLLLSLFFLLFGAVYEMFSHEVYSPFMIYAFIIPLLGGALPFLWLGLYTKAEYPQPIAAELHRSGISTLTVGSVVQGVLDIYGTTNVWMRIYWLAGVALLAVGLFLCLFHGFYLKSEVMESVEPNVAADRVSGKQILLSLFLLLLILLLTSVSALKMIGIL